MINIINQIFEMEQKMLTKQDISLDRNIKRLYHEFEEIGYKIINPLGKRYKETDADLEAKISGDFKDNMIVTRVLKPVIYRMVSNNDPELLQRGIVIVE